MQETRETWVQSLDLEELLEEETHSSILVWSLVDYSLQGCKESDMTEGLRRHVQPYRVDYYLSPHFTEGDQSKELKGLPQGHTVRKQWSQNSNPG